MNPQVDIYDIKYQIWKFGVVFTDNVSFSKDNTFS